MKAVNQSLPKSQTDGLGTFWTLTPEAVCVTLHCELGGLSSSEAERRLAQYGPNSDAETKADSLLRAVFRRLLEPLSLILGLVVALLATRVLLGRPVLDSLMFAVALAVGLTPELLPMITTVTLSRGAMRMAEHKDI